MNDMSGVIVPKSDQINADDLISGPMTITIREVQIRGGQEQPVSMYFEGSQKAYRPCKSMSRVFVSAWGPDAKVYIGRSVTLYRDPTVKWGGMEVGGIRISHMSHIDGKMQLALTATKGQRKPHVIMPLVMKTNPAGDGASRPKKTVADYKAEIDALPDLEAVVAWQAANDAIRSASSNAAKEIWSYCGARVEALIAASQPDGSSSLNDEIPEDF